MNKRVVSALALVAGLSVALTGAVVAADDLREVYDNKSDTIASAIDNENWQKTTDKSIEWAGQLGAWDGTYPADVDDANCYGEYDSLYTVSGAAAYGGHAMGSTNGKPGLVGNILYVAGQTEGPAFRLAVDTCIADAAVTEVEAEGGAGDVDPPPSPEVSES